MVLLLSKLKQKDQTMSKKLIRGFGINDADYPIRPRNGEACSYYKSWEGMLKRVYYKPDLIRHPEYKDVKVCDEWKYFSNFKKWMQSQDWVGKELDKDLIIPFNKIYSPDTCCFLTQSLNKFIKFKDGKLPLGVYKRKNRLSNSYETQIQVNGKRKTIACSSTLGEAENIYIDAKVKQIHEKIQTVDDDRIKGGLLKWTDVYINLKN